MSASKRGRAVGYITAIKGDRTIRIAMYNGQNSFGEPGRFAGARPPIKQLRGYPLHAVRLHLTGDGWTYSGMETDLSG